MAKSLTGGRSKSDVPSASEMEMRTVQGVPMGQNMAAIQKAKATGKGKAEVRRARVTKPKERIGMERERRTKVKTEGRTKAKAKGKAVILTRTSDVAYSRAMSGSIRC